MHIQKKSILINYRHNPYTDKLPYFSWKLDSGDQGEIQEKYRIIVKKRRCYLLGFRICKIK